jgi:ornithine decarboxylase
MGSVRSVIERSKVPLRCIDVGGGFPGRYLNHPVEDLSAYISTIVEATEDLDLPPGSRLFCEPGRGLSEGGESLIAQVQLRKGRSVYLNDGIYGSMNEEQTGLRRPHRMVATRAFAAQTRPFTVYGPTCDSVDVLPEAVELPADIREGDWIEFGAMGAYGAACRTSFNGFFVDTFVRVENEFVADPGQGA